MNEPMTATAHFRDGSADTQKVENECQIWRFSKTTFESRPDATHITIVDAKGNMLKDLVYVQTKRGMSMVNSLKKPVNAMAAVQSAVSQDHSSQPKKHGCIFITA